MSGLLWLLLIVLVIAAVVAKIKRAARVVIFRAEDLRRQQERMQAGEWPKDPERRVQGMRSSNVEQMVACASCGVYVPASEAFFYRGKVYCCEEHGRRP
ncbi:MAG: hypothetical protein NC112_00640 [Oxalobacter formigenes]|nr:hypothetical protein [Oxalobacter formigenes]